MEADPNLPQVFPNGNNYQEFRDALTDNFASETGLQLTANIVWGIDGIDRDGTDPTDGADIGSVIYADEMTFYHPDEQQYIASVCDDLLCVYSDYSCRYPESTYYNLFISNPEDYGGREKVVRCFMTAFRDWVLTDAAAQPSANETIPDLLDQYGVGQWEDLTVDDFANCTYGEFPVVGGNCFLLLFNWIWTNEDMSTDNPDYVAGRSNYDYYKSQIYVREEADGELDVKFIKLSVLTEASANLDFNRGIQLYDDWQAFGQDWRLNVDGQSKTDQFGNLFVDTPPNLDSILICDGGIFSYFYIQETIIQEAVFGIFLSLILAFVILTFATANWIIAIYSVFTIFVVVICVMGFGMANGWKLGVIEAVIYVMVVGMSVDYVVHLSEAYLASGESKREGRTRRMLGIVGSSVLSGAISTLLGIFWLFFATNQIFFKFGSFIFFLISCSCLMSLVAFTAAMTYVGPEGKNGNIYVCFQKCRAKCKGENMDNYEETANDVEMAGAQKTNEADNDDGMPESPKIDGGQLSTAL